MKKLISTISIASCLALCAGISNAQELKIPEGLSSVESVATAICIAFLENEGAARVVAETATGWQKRDTISPVPSLYGVFDYEHTETGLSVFATRENFKNRQTRYCGVIQFDANSPLNLDALNSLGMTADESEKSANGEVRTWSLEVGEAKYFLLAAVQPTSNEMNFFKHSN